MAQLKLRKLKSKDLFTIMRFLRKIGVEQIIEEFTSNTDVKDEEKTVERGASIISKIANLIFDNLDTLETEINILLADLTGTDQETIENIGLLEYSKLINDLIQSEDIKSFLSSFLSLGKLTA